MPSFINALTVTGLFYAMRLLFGYFGENESVSLKQKPT
jgi:hypothetical protein